MPRWTGSAGTLVRRLGLPAVFVATLALLSLTVSLVPPVAHAGLCPFGSVVRKEWRDMSRAEKEIYLNAVRKLQTPKGPGRPSTYDIIVSIHSGESAKIHGFANFLPWHRLYLFIFEFVLRNVDRRAFIPYWNWPYDSQAPELADVWGSGPLAFGTNGNRHPDKCITDGAFAGWRPTTPEPHCLRREWATPDTLAAFASVENVQSIIATSNNYDAFRLALESGPHNFVHVAIGGASGDMKRMWSPNDPIFFLHHCFIDKVWANWQALGGVRPTDYNGPGPGNTQAGPKESMPLFEVEASMAFNTRTLCYTYAEMNTPGVALPAPEPNLARLRIRRRMWRRAAQALQAPAGAPDPMVEVQKGVPPPLVLSSTERTVLNKLLSPDPLDEAWIRLNNLRVEDVRMVELVTKAQIQKLNGVDGYTSPCALWNRLDSLKKLIEKVGTSDKPDAVDKLVVFTENKAIVVEHVALDAAQAAANVVDRVQKQCTGGTLQKPVEVVAPKVVAVIGPAVAAPGAADNPLAPRADGQLAKGDFKEFQEAKGNGVAKGQQAAGAPAAAPAAAPAVVNPGGNVPKGQAKGLQQP